MNNSKTQWRKRVDVFQYIYSLLMRSEFDEKFIKEDAFENHLFEIDQLKTIEYFAEHVRAIIKELSNNLGTNWTWDRISSVEKAIMIDAVCEARSNKINRKIIIDQALITTKKFAHKDATKYINAVLDKVIK